MERRAHLLAAAATALAAAKLLGFNTVEAAAAMWVSVVAAGVPDLDLRRGHRVLLHNLCFAAASGAVIGLLLFSPYSPVPAPLAAALLAGWEAGLLSHLLLDALTVSGVALFYPCSRRRIRLARLRSSSRAANLVVEAASLAAILYLSASLALGG